MNKKFKIGERKMKRNNEVKRKIEKERVNEGKNKEKKT